jgi:hypothetical protein
MGLGTSVPALARIAQDPDATGGQPWSGREPRADLAQGERLSLPSKIVRGGTS